jgi:hypothetical protein
MAQAGVEVAQLDSALAAAGEIVSRLADAK